jgi:hypothetical protein
MVAAAGKHNGLRKPPSAPAWRKLLAIFLLPSSDRDVMERSGSSLIWVYQDSTRLRSPVLNARLLVRLARCHSAAACGPSSGSPAEKPDVGK